MPAPASDNAMACLASIAFNAGKTESCNACANLVQSAGCSAINLVIWSGERFTAGSLLMPPTGATCLPWDQDQVTGFNNSDGSGSDIIPFLIRLRRLFFNSRGSH